MAELLCKYYKKQRYVSYNDGLTWQPLEEYEKGELYETHSASCGAGVFQYRWVIINNGYICDGLDRYTKEIYQYSEDGAVWYNVFPTVFRKGTLVERDSEFCDNAGTGQYIDVDSDPTSGTPCPPDFHWDGHECVCDGVVANGECIVCKGGTTWNGTECICPNDGNHYWDGVNCLHIDWSAGGHPHTDSYRGINDPLKIIKCSTSNGILTSADTQYYTSGWSIITYEIGDCIYRIDDNAFNGQTYMSEITIPSSVVEIGDWAFSNCNSLPTISIPTSALTELGEGAFNNCSSLSGITFGGEIPSDLSNSLFANCIRLQSVPWLSTHNITSIGDRAFYNCYALSNIVFPNSLQTIGSSAFCSNYALENIIIPTGVTSIGASAFENCSAITNVRIDAVGNIPVYISSPEYVEKTSDVTRLNIPLGEVLTEDTVIEIDHIINGADTLIGDANNEAHQMEYTTQYGGWASTAVKYVVLRINGKNTGYENVNSLENRRLHLEIGNKYVKNLDNDEYWINESGETFSNGGEILLFPRYYGNLSTLGCKIFSLKIKKNGKLVKDFIPYIDNQGSYALFDNISKEVFYASTYPGILNQLTGSSEIVDHIAYYAPATVGDNAFAKCTSLTSVTVNSQNINLGNGVFRGCTKLLKITFTATEPFAIDEYDFDNTNECALFVPCASVNAYKEAWPQYAHRISCNDTGIYYRWVDDDGIYCDGTDAYTRQKQQETTNGITWTDNGVYRPKTLITHYSPDCGFHGDFALTVTDNDGKTRYYEPCEYQ